MAAEDVPYLKPEDKIPCPWLFDRMCMNARGEFTFCGSDSYFKYKYADLRERPISEIWHCEALEKVRKIHLEQRHDELEMCRDCPDLRFYPLK